MKIRTLEDGTLLLEERFTLARWGTAIGAAALVAVFVWTWFVRGQISGREMLGGSVGFLALLGVAAAVADRTFHFDRGASTLRWKVQYLFATRSGEIPFADVIKVSLLTSNDIDDPHRRPVYLPILITREKPITLSSLYSRDSAAGEELAKAVGQALGRPMVPAREATVEELVAAGRIIDAVKQVRRQSAVGGRVMDLAQAKAIVESYRNAPEIGEEQRRAA